jgi:hypothetical protein
VGAPDGLEVSAEVLEVDASAIALPTTVIAYLGADRRSSPWPLRRRARVLVIPGVAARTYTLIRPSAICWSLCRTPIQEAQLLACF